MPLKVTKTDVWAADIQDTPGGLAEALGQLAAGGANLDCVIARRKPDQPGVGIAFVTPLSGKGVLAAARRAGFNHAGRIATLKIEGSNKRGLGHAITRAVGDAGVSMRGLSAAVIGNKFVAYLGFDNDRAASIAARAIKALDRKKK